MSKDLKKIILILSLVYSLSVALFCSAIILAGGGSHMKLLVFWLFLLAAGIVIAFAKVSPMCTLFLALLKKRRVYHEV